MTLETTRTPGRRRHGGTAVKIFVTGSFSAGKTTLIRTISETTVLSAEQDITDDTRSRKAATTVAMDASPLTATWCPTCSVRPGRSASTSCGRSSGQSRPSCWPCCTAPWAPSTTSPNRRGLSRVDLSPPRRRSARARRSRAADTDAGAPGPPVLLRPARHPGLGSRARTFGPRVFGLRVRFCASRARARAPARGTRASRAGGSHEPACAAAGRAPVGHSRSAFVLGRAAAAGPALRHRPRHPSSAGCPCSDVERLARSPRWQYDPSPARLHPGPCARTARSHPDRTPLTVPGPAPAPRRPEQVPRPPAPVLRPPARTACHPRRYRGACGLGPPARQLSPPARRRARACSRMNVSAAMRRSA